MKKDSIVFLTAFSGINSFYSLQKSLINLVSIKFKNIYFMNSDYLKLFSGEYAEKKKISKKILNNFPKNIKFFNPKNFNDVDSFLKDKKPMIVNNIGRGFDVYPILFYLRKKKIPQVLIGHVGNIQGSTYYWHKINLNIIKYFFTVLLPRWISRIMVVLGLFSQIDVRFISNKKIYKGFLKEKKKFFPAYYNKFVLVKSKIFDEDLNKKKIQEKYILHLDQDPDYRAMKIVSQLDKNLVKKHYLNLNRLLKLLSKIYKKKVIISIHPLYSQKKTEKRFKNFKVIKMKTNELIEKSFLITFFDSSAILHAIKLKKKILSIRSDLFYGGKKYNSDLYANLIGTKKVNISKNIYIDKTKFLKEVKSKIKNYDKYLRTYASFDNTIETGSEKIIKYINSRYF